jgi:exodeoxyribonuclease V beta subunit
VSDFDPGAIRLSGTSLIEASAGTGKTHTIGTLFLRLIVEAKRSVGEILVVTFTNAATAELRDRLRRRLREALDLVRGNDVPGAALADHPWLAQASKDDPGGVADRLNLALHGFDEAAIFTIHGFCQRVLQENAFESGTPFDVEMMTDQAQLLGDVVRDFWVNELHAAPVAFVRHLKVTPGMLERLLNEALSHPGITLVDTPEDETAEDVAPLLAAIEQARAPVVKVWTQEREAILDALCSPALSRVTYKPDRIRSIWAPQLDAALAHPGPGVHERFDKFDKLTQAGVAAATKKKETPPRHPFFERCEALLAAEQQLGQTFVRMERALVRRAFETLPKQLRARKREARVQSFDDLLQNVDCALRGPAGETLAEAVRQRYHAALIDEFQDTDPLQYAIFRRIYADGEAPLLFVGDPKQAIYSFRGADVFAYLDARGIAGDQIHTLARNWRSDPSLIQALNDFFASHPDPFASPDIPYVPVSPRPGAADRLGAGDHPALRFLVDESGGGDLVNKGDAMPHVAAATASEIVQLLDSQEPVTTAAGRQPVRPGDIAVLCRTNSQAQEVHRELIKRRVPAVFQTQQTVFEVAEAGEMLRVLHAMAEPHDAGRVRAALATSLVGIDAAGLDLLLVDEDAWERWGQTFLRLSARWKASGFMAAFQSLLETAAVTDRLLSGDGGERRLTDVLHLAELIHTTEVAGRLRPQSVVRWLGEMCSDAEARRTLVGEAAQIRLETDDDAVHIVTIHRSKGLEYPIVFCPHLWAPVVPNRKQAMRTFHDPQTRALRLSVAPRGEHPDNVAPLAEAEREAEDLRLLYVALTRAKHRCYVVWGNFRDAAKSSLARFLGDPANGMVERIDELAAQSGGTIGRAPLQANDARRERASRELPQLAPREARRSVRPAVAQSSFSSLVKAALAADEQEGVDHDAVDAPEDDGSGTDRPLAGTERGAVAQRVPLDTFPGGRVAGDFFHAVFEKLDFTGADEAKIRTLVQGKLPVFGLEPERATVVAGAIDGILRTEMPHPGGSLRLDAMPAHQRRTEMEFLFPVAGGGARADAIAGAFAREATSDAVRTWAAGLRQRRIAPLDGHLRGFVDLIFRHDDRWYVADYKSNHLGPSPADYVAARLAAAMAAHDYFLQYHLYVLGLVKHLRARMPDFDYERDFGGVFYLFLRGMAPEHPPGCGVYFDRPPHALVEALEAAFGGGGR